MGFSQEWLFYPYWLAILAEEQKKIWTILDLIRWGADFFAKKNIDSPRLTIELLLCDTLNFERIDLYTNHEKPLTAAELAKLKSMVLRRAKHEPLQYITGTTHFFGLEFLSDNSAIIPRPETEILVELVIRNIKEFCKIEKILEIGTGSGCIAITIAKYCPEQAIIAIDVSEKALNLASRNAQKNNVNSITFEKCDILESLPSSSCFDIIVSNPPYIPFDDYLNLALEILDFEPKEALTDCGDGLSFYKRFSEIFPSLLNPGGTFYLEICGENAESIREIFSRNMFEISIIKDFNNLKRFLIGKLIS